MVGGRDSTFSANNVERSGLTLVESIEKKKRRRNPSSLELIEAEMGAQTRELPLFALELQREKKGLLDDPREAVFTGSGDSYATSLYAHYLSGGRATAADPYDLLLDPDQCRKKTVFLTSVSGRTQANIKLAKRLENATSNRVAITADPTSPLAKECDITVQLPYRNPGTLTPGTLSFTLSLLAVASRIRSLSKLHGLEAAFSRASNSARSVKTLSNKFLFVGTEIGYSLAAYASFKIHEVLGQQADYEHTEQVGHSKLFSLKKTDNIVCFASKRDRNALALCAGLRKAGFQPYLMKSRSTDPVLGGLEAAFVSQFLALDLARRSGLDQVAFMKDRKMLRLSSRLIY